jgi:hypothetical protein
MNLIQPNEAPAEFQGRSFYPAGVLAAYCVVFTPMGFFLYGLNLVRRGSRVMGWSLTVVSVALTTALMVSVAINHPPSGGIGVFGVAAAIGILKMEAPQYRRAIAKGGSTAKWWPPSLMVLALVLVTGLIATIFDKSL